VTDRDENSWELSSTDLAEINLVDCEDAVDLVFTVTYDSESTTDRELYLYEGASCDEDPEECRIVGDGQSTSDTTFSIAANELFENGCDSSDTATLWPALLESEDQNEDDDGTWGGTLSVSLDITGPSAVASSLSTTVGSGNVRVRWDEVDDDEVEGFLVVYWRDPASKGADAEEDAGVGDTDGEECSFSGGFEEGDAYDSSLVTGFEDTAMADADATSATVEGLTNGVSYKFAVLSLDEAANPSAFSEIVCDSPEQTVGFDDIYSDAGGSGTGEYCFIATAAFGSYDHPTVRVLRRFRDEFLAKMPGGRSVIAAYYTVGPALARVIEGHEALREAVAGALTVFSFATIGLVALGPGRFAILLALCLASGLALGFALPKQSGPVGYLTESS